MSGSWDAMLEDEQRRFSSQAGLASIRTGVGISQPVPRPPFADADHEIRGQER